jgi:O-antigen/teichoic acid export membrane protein
VSDSVIPVSLQRRLSWIFSVRDPDGTSATDSTTQGNRARWHRQASLTTTAGIVAKAIGIGVRFVTIPLALRLLGSERYGLWLSIGSALAWIGFVGPGLGYGLVNALSDAAGRDDVPAMRRHVSTAFFTIWSLGLLLLISIPLLAGWSGWAQLLGVAGRPDLTREALALVGVAATLFALSFALEVIGPVCSGLQEGYLTSVASIAASVLVLAGVVGLALDGGTLVAFALVVGLPPIVTNLALSVYVLWRRHPGLRPTWRLWNRDSFASLMSFGGWMFLAQMGELAIFQSANILIANRFGPGEVPRYAVPAALFMNLTNVCYLIVQPYWPALKEASVREDWDWIRMAMSRTLKIRVAMMALAGIAVVIGGPAFIRLWAGEQGVPTRSLLVAMSVYYVLVAWSGNYVVLLLGLGLVRIKTLLTLLVGVAHIVGFFLLSPFVGLSAIPLGGALGVIADGFFASRAASRHIREQERRAAARVGAPLAL